MKNFLQQEAELEAGRRWGSSVLNISDPEYVFSGANFLVILAGGCVERLAWNTIYQRWD